MGQRGRPGKLTEDVRSRLLQAIRAGNYYEPACRLAGVSYSAFRQWVQRGEQATSGEYFDFVEELRQAEAAAEVRIVSQWQQQIPQNWQAARDFLARRYPDRWAHTEKVRLLVEQEIEKELSHTLDKLENRLPSDLYSQVLAALADGADGESEGG